MHSWAEGNGFGSRSCQSLVFSVETPAEIAKTAVVWQYFVRDVLRNHEPSWKRLGLIGSEAAAAPAEGRCGDFGSLQPMMALGNEDRRLAEVGRVVHDGA